MVVLVVEIPQMQCSFVRQSGDKADLSLRHHRELIAASHLIDRTDPPSSSTN